MLKLIGVVFFSFAYMLTKVWGPPPEEIAPQSENTDFMEKTEDTGWGQVLALSLTTFGANHQSSVHSFVRRVKISLSYVPSWLAVRFRWEKRWFFRSIIITIITIIIMHLCIPCNIILSPHLEGVALVHCVPTQFWPSPKLLFLQWFP